MSSHTGLHADPSRGSRRVTRPPCNPAPDNRDDQPDEEESTWTRTRKKISALLHEAARRTTVVYRITDGEDPDWASWYGDWLIDHSELPELLGGPPVRSHLVAELVALEGEFGAEQGWEDRYAARLVERFGMRA